MWYVMYSDFLDFKNYFHGEKMKWFLFSLQDKNQKQNCKTAYVEANQYEDLKKQGKIYTEIQKKDQQNKFVKRRYRPEWEQEFPFITQSFHKSEPQAYCKICQTHVVNKKSYLRTHMGSVKHKKYSTQRQWA